MMKHKLKEITLHKPFLFLLFLIFTASANAQLFAPRVYPQNFFIYPVDARISLSGNFGELRTNHFHMGLDCRTNQVENRPVKAAADGYVSRVSVAPFGFGRAIYITHANGLTTVYGHLNKFYPALESYLIDHQYKMKSWATNLELQPGMFEVKKGQFIANSGNTGGSMGPHLHFEIRDTKTDKVLNPLLFNLPVADPIPPDIQHLYMYDRCISTYSQSAQHLPIRKIGNHYTTTQAVIPVHTDKVSFGITATDKQSGSNFSNGIYEAVIYLDGKALNGFQLDSIDYLESRYINAHIDYKKKAEGGPYVQHLSRLPGYPQGVHEDFVNDGVIELHDNNVHDIEIIVKDTRGNASKLAFKIKKELVKEKGNTAQNASFYDKVEFHPGFVNVFENEDLYLHLSPQALYDSLSFQYAQKASSQPNSYSDNFSVLSGLVPSHDFFTIKLRANKPLPDSLQKKVLMKRTWKGSTEYVQAIPDGDWYSAKFRAFGDFELIIDTIPPVIGGMANGSNLSGAHRIVFTPRDNSGIKSFNAYLNDNWLMFTNDKARNFIYIFDEKCPKGNHTLKVIVEDIAGNVSQREIKFTR